MSFRAEKAGLYRISVHDRAKQPVASRNIEIRDLNLEYQNTARNLEVLKQWAALSDGLAVKAEDCRDPSALVAQIKKRIDRVRQGRTTRVPIGINAWTLTALIGGLAAEWILRKRWALV